MNWHNYSEEKPKPSEICLIKYFYDKQKFGNTKPNYMLCEYSNLGEESSELWTELNNEEETYGSNCSEYWISISEIEECFAKHTCSKCGRDATNINYYQKDNELYCSVCVYDFLKSHTECEYITIEEALHKYGFSIISTTKDKYRNINLKKN